MQTTATRRTLSASTLAGDAVRNLEGDSLGKIEDLMIDMPTGRVAYAVLSFGGVMGLGNKLFAVPFNSLKLDADKHEFVLDASKQRLAEAPGFDKNNWPDMTNIAWNRDVHAYYGLDYVE